jgi:putrescine transport system substrate-binding protein
MVRKTLLAAAALLLFASAALAQKPSVSLFNWADYVPTAVVKAFEKQTGIKLFYSVFDSNEILDARLRENKPSYDVVVPRASPFLASQVADKLYQPLDRSRLKNYGNLDPVVLALLAKYDPGNDHAVPYMWGTIGIGYNIEKLKRILPDTKADSLSLLFDPQFVSKFKDCGVMVLDSPAEMIPAALKYLGLDPDSKSEADLTKAVDVWRAIRPFIRKFALADFVSQFTQGNACLAFGYSGDIEDARHRAAQTKGRGKVNIGYAVPREGALVWIDALAIPANAPDPDSAYKLVDFLLDAQIAAQSSLATGYATANAAARPLLDAAIADDKGLYPPADVVDKLYAVTPADRRYDQQRLHAWNSMKGSK